VCKYVQGLPKLTRTDKCTTLLGWTSIECYIDSKKLLFLGRLCNMPSRFLPKQIFITRLLLYLNNCTTIRGGFIPDIIKIVRKYDLFSYVDNFVKTSLFPSSKKWKYLIKSSVIAYEEHCLHERFNIDTDFTYFRLIQERILPHRAWTVLKSHKQLRTQCQYVVSLCALVKENEHELRCHKCGLLYWDPIVHRIASCPSGITIRDELWCEIINIGPIEFSATLHQMDDLNLVMTLLSCDSERFFDLSKSDSDLFSALSVSFIYKICKHF
jgi:hypothetical protein